MQRRLPPVGHLSQSSSTRIEVYLPLAGVGYTAIIYMLQMVVTFETRARAHSHISRFSVGFRVLDQV